MTEKLKEKIAKWLFRDDLHPTSKIDWENKWTKLTEQDKQYWLNKADKLLSLIEPVKVRVLRDEEIQHIWDEGGDGWISWVQFGQSVSQATVDKIRELNPGRKFEEV